VDAAQRFDFFEFVRNRWGPERASQLMDMLPPAGADELVTTSHLRAEMADIRSELADRIADQTRTLLLAMMTLWISGIALAFIAARFTA
jgi:hypothetical protein